MANIRLSSYNVFQPNHLPKTNYNIYFARVIILANFL